MPVAFIQDLIAELTNPDFKPTEYLDLLKDVEQTRDGLRAAPTYPGGPGGTTMVVGHSLGGCYTNIVGTLARVPTFALSPPGLYYGIRKFGIDYAAELYPWVQSIRPDHDPVPLADWQVGAVQNIPCTVELDGLGSRGACHSVLRTLSMLVSACPDTTHPGRAWGIERSATKDLPAEVVFTKDGAASGKNVVKTPEGWSG